MASQWAPATMTRTNTLLCFQHDIMMSMSKRESRKISAKSIFVKIYFAVWKDLGISAETFGLGDVFPPDELGSGPCTPFIIYIPYIIAAILHFSCIVQYSLYHDMDIGTM